MTLSVPKTLTMAEMLSLFARVVVFLELYFGHFSTPDQTSYWQIHDSIPSSRLVGELNTLIDTLTDDHIVITLTMLSDKF